MPEPAIPDAATKELWIPVGGMTCASCQAHVRGALTKIDGVESADVSLVERSARVRFKPTFTSPEALVHAIEQEGYEAELVDDQGASDEDAAVERAAAKEERTLRLRLLVAMPAFLVVMAFTMPDPLSMFSLHATHAGAHAVGHAVTQPMAIAMLALTVLALAFSAGSFYGRALAGLKTGTSSMSTLVALGTFAAVAWSAVAALFPDWMSARGVAPDLYLEAALGIVAFVLVGHNLEARARRAGRKSVRALAALVPKSARVRVERDDGKTDDKEIDAAKLRRGDLLVVRPGERVAADARITEGSSHLDESLLSGESAPRARGVGEPIVAGSINGGGVLVARVTSVGRDSTLSRILAMVRRAQGTRAAAQDLADRISARFVPAVIAIAAVTLVAWLLLSGDVARALTSAIAVVIVACPCAMGLAVPAAIAVAVGRSARLGVLWRDATALERAAAIDTIVVDKTGTLTFGQPRVVRATAIAGASVDDALAAAAALEHSSEHVLARALTDEAKRRGLAVPVATDIKATAGGGIVGTVNGARVAIGSARFLRDLSVPVDDTRDTRATVWVARGDEAVLAIEIDDVVRPTSAAGVQRLGALGVDVWMLSGDAQARADEVAAALGITNVVAEARPQDKLDTIEKLVAASKKVGMVGDGVNDAPALARAHVGFALRSGTDVALEAADVSVSGAGVAQVALAIELARATVRVMKQNLFWAFAYNVVAIPLAAGALWPLFGIALSPVVASAAMAASSVTVVTNSLRLALAGRPTASSDEGGEERAR